MSCLPGARKSSPIPKRAGATLPKPVRTAYTRATRISEGGRSLASPSDDLAQTIANAIADGRDPAADPEVQRILTAGQIANEGTMQALDRIAFAEFSEVCHQQDDAIVAAWCEPFDQAAAALTVAHSHIGDVPLTDAQTILHKGANIAEVWASARGAVETIDALLVAWTALMSFARLVSPQKGHEVLRLAVIDWPRWPDPNPWVVVRAGFKLSLPTADEYAQRVAVIEEGIRRAQLEAQRQREAGVFVR